MLKQFVTLMILTLCCQFSLRFRSTDDTACFDADDYETVESKYIGDQTISDKYRATLNSLGTV